MGVSGMDLEGVSAETSTRLASGRQARRNDPFEDGLDAWLEEEGVWAGDGAREEWWGDDPETDPDRLVALGDEIATLAGYINAATHRFLTLIAEFDRLRGWEREGHRSCAEWLHFRTGLDRGAAREKVRAARALVGLPETSAAMSRGELSFAKVRALTRVADAKSEGDLLEFAKGATAAQVERFVRSYKLMGRKSEAEMEEIRHASRTLSVFPGDDGMYVLRGHLDPEVGALLMRAIEAASDALFREDAKEVTTPEQRRADALALLAERAMAMGFEGGASGTPAQRYQVLLHVEPGTLEQDAEPGRSHLEDGTRVSAETSRRLTCDASVVEVTHGEDGSVLDVGRRTRTISPALRRALESRDGGCLFPGCDVRFTSGHHLVHWADGGETKLANLGSLCRFHHRLVHEGGFGMELGVHGRPEFTDRKGRPIPGEPPPGRALPEPLEAWLRQRRVELIGLSARTSGSRWKREIDIPWEVEARAREAVDG